MLSDELRHLGHLVTDLEHRFKASEERRSQETTVRHPQPKPLTILHWVWRRVSPEERIRFLIEMLTPNERRALQMGFEETEP